MRKTVFIFLLLICGAACAQGKNEEADGSQLTGKMTKVQKEVTDSLCTALMALGEVMPPVGGDTESYWAADTLKAIGTELLKGEGTYMERMAKIYAMQSFYAYGMNYFRAIVSMYGDHSDMASSALHGAMHVEQLYHVLDSLQFNDFMAYKDIAAYSQYYTQMIVPLLQTANRTKDVKMGPLGCSLLTKQIIEKMKELKYKESDMFKVQTILDAADFYNSFCTQINYTTQSEESHEIIKGKLIESALFFDDYGKPIRSQYISDPSKIDVMGDEEFDAFLLKATGYKCMLLRMLTGNLVEVAKRIEKQKQEGTTD